MTSDLRQVFASHIRNKVLVKKNEAIRAIKTIPSLREVNEDMWDSIRQKIRYAASLKK
jgi:hypothetical protein